MLSYSPALLCYGLQGTVQNASQHFSKELAPLTKSVDFDQEYNMWWFRQKVISVSRLQDRTILMLVAMEWGIQTLSTLVAVKICYQGYTQYFHTTCIIVHGFGERIEPPYNYQLYHLGQTYFKSNHNPSLFRSSLTPLETRPPRVIPSLTRPRRAHLDPDLCMFSSLIKRCSHI